MAKRKAEQPKPQGISSIEYIQLIESLPEKAFNYYVDCVYPLLKFRILKRDDLRLIDFEEKLLNRIKDYYYLVSSPRITEDTSVKRIVEDISNFSEGMGIVRESRASLYMNRAEEIYDRLSAGNGTEEDLCDFIVLFISFIRACKASNNKGISDIECEIGSDAKELLNWAIYEEGLKFTSTKGRIKTVSIPAKNMKEADKDLLFITMMLFACISMTEAGLFEEED